jgi:uncharacterized membrane protein YgcG
MIGPRNLHPDELGEAEGMDIQDAVRVGNRLVEAMDEVPMPAGESFVDNVMASLADEPTPGSTGFLVPLRRRGILGGFRESFGQAWASVGAGRPIVGRSAALAYVLAVVVAGVSLTGAVALGTAGALGVFNAAPTDSPTPLPPAPTAVPPTVAPSPSENASEPTVGPTPSPSETDDETDETDDPNDNSGPGGVGDDDTGSGGDGDSSGPGGNSGPGSSGSGSDDAGRGSDSSGPGSDNEGPG